MPSRATLRRSRARTSRVAIVGAMLLAACTLDKTPPSIGEVSPAPDAGASSAFDANGVIRLAPPRPIADSGTPTDAGARGQTGSHDGADDVDSGHGHGRHKKDAGSDRDAASAKPDACDAACPAELPACLPNGTCAQCAADSDCPKDAPRCDTQSFTCVACLEHGDCPKATPACDVAAHVCRQCVDESQCSAPMGHCDTSTHVCVQCMNDRACSGGTSRCDTSAHRCVECASDADCRRAEAAQCQTGKCVRCTTNEHCAHIAGDRHICGNNGEHAGDCVECLSNGDCKDTANPECDDDHCAPCTSDAACEGRTGAGVCDDDDQSDESDEGGSGACVECTSDHADACASGACDEGEHRCAASAPEGAAACSSCEHSSECADGLRCRSLRLGGRTVGHYCAPRDNDGCLASCAFGIPIGC